MVPDGAQADFSRRRRQGKRFRLKPQPAQVRGSPSSQLDDLNCDIQVGWHEHNPLEIWQNVLQCMDAVVQALHKKRVKFAIKSIGITNQRETTVAWNATTGKPYYNAIVWDDTRTNQIASHIAAGNPDRLRAKTGLPLASYFAGTKVKWLLDNVPDLQADVQSKPEEVRFGTIDTWILYQLSGKPSEVEGAANVGGLFLTDVTNASRTLFMDIAKVEWGKSLGMPMRCFSWKPRNPYNSIL
jgi:glycerol kinase